MKVKPIKLIIISIFIFSGLLAYLLFIQKSKRIDGQLQKKTIGWNPVAIKKIILTKKDHDTILLSKSDGVWKTNRQFDAMGIAPQLLVYLSTMQIEIPTNPSEKLEDGILLQTFDKTGAPINSMYVGRTVEVGKCLARLNESSSLVLLSNKMNSASLHDLLLQAY